MIDPKFFALLFLILSVSQVIALIAFTYFILKERKDNFQEVARLSLKKLVLKKFSVQLFIVCNGISTICLILMIFWKFKN